MRALVIAWIALACTGEAGAYPHFQRISGTARCAQCHVSPSGGGLLTPWGIEESSDTIGRGGDGRFLHGAVTLPESVLAGGNIRVAALAHDVGASGGADLAAFPMQADLAMAVRHDAWTVVVSAGARGRVRSGAPTAPDGVANEATASSLASLAISREHYVMWRPDEAAGAYVRVGRFAAPYGLRLADHTAYVRRYLGYNLLEETYGVGGGWFGDTVELHATAFVFDPLQHASRKVAGAALLLEAQPGDTLVVGGSARLDAAAVVTRLQVGGHAKLYLDGSDVLLQAELDGAREMFDGPGDRWQLAAYAGPVWNVVRGLYAGVAYQAFTPDVRVRGVSRHGVDAFASFIPRAHVEIMASARAQRIGPQERAFTGMLQLHYWL